MDQYLAVHCVNNLLNRLEIDQVNRFVKKINEEYKTDTEHDDNDLNK